MSFDFATAGAQLEAYLKPLLPADWKVQDAEKPLGQSLAVVLTYTRGDASTEIDGQVMAPGSVGVDFVLILSTPEKDPTKGWPRLNAAAPALIRALDENSQLIWSRAERGVLKTGESIYLIPITVIASTAAPAEPEE